MISVIGLGIDNLDITLKAVEKIKRCDKVFVKTMKTPTYKFFIDNDIDVESFDNFYDEAEDFQTLNKLIIERLQGENGDICFCVNGNGSDDSTVQELKKVENIEIIEGISNADFVLKNNPDTSFSSYSAYDVVFSKAFIPDKRHAVIIKEIDNKFLAGDLKLVLENVYGDDKEIILSQYVNKTYKLTHIILSDLDRQKQYDYSCQILIPNETFLEARRHDMADLIEIMENLLSEDGCPWDRAQTHESVRVNLIEEAYELVDAIDKNDIDGMIEESGDVLLQAIFHCMIGKVDGEYNYNDVMTGLCHKLISRHTHIFGDNKAKNPEEALKCWTNAKNIEKQYTSYTDKMEKLPKNLPALIYCYKMQKIAVKCGFDWHDIDGTFDKLNEEINEFKNSNDDDAVMEAGDVLFSAVNPMRWKHIEPETALRLACEKFLNRFRFMEENIKKDGKNLEDESTREEYWKKAKEIYK